MTFKEFRDEKLKDSEIRAEYERLRRMQAVLDSAEYVSEEEQEELKKELDAMIPDDWEIVRTEVVKI